MPAPQHIRMIWEGVFGSPSLPEETWQFGLSAPPLALDDADTTPYAEHQAEMLTFWNNVRQLLVTSVVLTNTRVALVGPDGRYTRTQSGRYAMSDTARNSPGASANTGRYPSQVALAVSLQSDLPGPTGRGRFYLPGPNQLVDPFRMTTAVRDTTLTALRTALDGLDGALKVITPGTGLGLVIASGGSAVQGVAPGLRQVTSVGLGRRLDIQRRRGDDMDEDKAFLAL